VTTRQVLDHGFITLEDAAMAQDANVVRAARICYQSESDQGTRDAALIRRLMRSGHMTPFEHAVMRWHVKCPLFVARQWLRHRMASYNEKSLRYCIAEPEWYMPAGKTFIQQMAYNAGIRQAFKAYDLLICEGWPPEQARGVLPMSVYTEFVWTVNASSLMNWLKQRLAKGAQWEHQQYAEAALELWTDAMPVTALAFVEKLGAYE